MYPARQQQSPDPVGEIIRGQSGAEAVSAPVIGQSLIGGQTVSISAPVDTAEIKLQASLPLAGNVF